MKPNEFCPVINHTMELADCTDSWTFDEYHQCWCLEDVLYTPAAVVPKFQRLSIFVPKAYMSAPGVIDPNGTCGSYTANTVPVVFENNSAGYMQMPHTWLGGPRCYAEQYLKHGLIYVTCGCRGRESRDAAGRSVGKSPISLIDLKTAIRFLRHNKAALPGDMSKLISVGWSAGGAMSTLLGVTGDNAVYMPYLEQNSAFMEESDAVYAAQIYCPIIDLEHADLAYEWMFRADKQCENSPAGPAETMTPFKEALSKELSDRYVTYINSLGFTHPVTGKPLTLNEDGRSGGFYDYLMDCLNASATDFLTRLEQHRLPQTYSAEDYLHGRYTFEAPKPMPPKSPGAPPEMHHAGPGIGMPMMPPPGDMPPLGKQPIPPMPPSLGDLMSRPPKGVPFLDMKPAMVAHPGTEKSWLSWDGKHAIINDLDTYVCCHRRRMKPCTSFDKLTCDSGENQEFGNATQDSVHFVPVIGEAIAAIAADFPEEAAEYQEAFLNCMDDALSEKIRLINPMHFIGTGEESVQAKHYRIRVGASDADTSLSVSMMLALKLKQADCVTVDYAQVWDRPHSEADYEGEVLEWIDRICKTAQ